MAKKRNRNQQIAPEAVLARLKRAGVNINHLDDILIALETEIRHYRDVIGQISQNPRRMPGGPETVYDFERCLGQTELTNALLDLNDHGLRLITVTQDGDLYTLFFEGIVGG